MQTRVYRTKSGAEYTLTQTKAPAEKPARKKAAKPAAKKPAAKKQATAKRRVRKIVTVAVLVPKPAKAKDGQQMKLWSN
jgi:hypothetical protein